MLTPTGRVSRPVSLVAAAAVALGVIALVLAVCVAPAVAQVVPPDPPESFAVEVGGSWGPVLVWPHIPVSMANLPDGRVLTYSSNEPNDFPNSTNDEYTHAAVWDPATGEIKDVPHPSHDMFCSALVMLESGEPFVMGGRNFGFSPWTSFYDYHNDQWVQIGDMDRGRWYPTAVYLGTGEVLVVGGDGGGVHPELWEPQTGWKVLTGIDITNTMLQWGMVDGGGQWPLLQLAQDGTVFHHGATDEMNTLDPFGGPSNLGTITGLGPHNYGWFPDEGISVLYDEGKILVAGGSTSPLDSTAQAGAYTIDITGPAPTIQSTAAMHWPRQFQNEIVVPTGDVIVVGGNTSGVKFRDAYAVKNAELWSPTTGLWTKLNGQDQARPYHSTALLLPDATILSAGGGLAGDDCTVMEGPGECEDDHWNAEVFTPPYLYEAGGALASRPSILDAPGVVRVGRTITVQATPGLTSFSLIRMAATTHTVNTDQRFLRPAMVETSPGTYELTLHGNLHVLVPGYWMLFGNQGQVPSVAHVMQVVKDGVPRGKPIPGLRNNVGEEVLLQIDAEDPDGNPLSFVASGLPSGLSIDPATGVISGTVDTVGVSNVVVTANDGTEAGMVSFSWVVSTVRSEIGTLSVTQADKFQWHTVNLSSSFQNPVVVMGPPSYNDTEPTTIRVRNVGSSSFEFQVDDWQYLNGAHSQEDVSYLVVEAGEYLLPGGGSLLAGVTTGIDRSNPRVQPFTPGAFLQPPAVLAQLATVNWSQALTARLKDVTATEVEISIQSEEKKNPNIPPEDVHWIAVEPTAIPGLLDAGIQSGVDENADLISFSQGFSNVPHVLGSIQTTNEIDTVTLRHLNGSSAGVEVLVQEETSDDAETDHVDESVGWLAVDPAVTSLGLLPLFNQLPVVASPGDQLSFEGAAVSLTVQASDPDGDDLDFSATGLPPGLAIDMVSGEISGTPTTAGIYPVMVTATDTSAESGESAFVWTVQMSLALVPFASPPQLSGASVDYTAQTNLVGSFDFTWDFGDGTPPVGPQSSPDASHVFATPGRYVVTLTVFDPVTLAMDQIQFVQNVTGAPTLQRPTASSSIAYEPANDRVWAVNPDNDTVTVIDAVTHAKLAEPPVCDDPRSIAVAGDGRVWVSCKDAAAIDILSPSTWSVVQTLTLPPGSEPHGLAFDPAGANAFVALEAAGEVLRLDGTTGVELASQSVGRNVRHLAVTHDGATVYASRFVTPRLPGEESGSPGVAGVGGEVASLDAVTLAPGTTLLLAAQTIPDGEFNARGIPNYLGAPAISPQGDEMLVASKQDNVMRGDLRDGLDLTFDSTVRAITSRVDLGTGTEDLVARLDHDDASIANATIYSLSGAYAFSALEGNRQVVIIDALTSDELGRFDTGRAPHGAVISPDGLTLFVDDFMDRTVSIYGLQALLDYDDLVLPVHAIVSKVATEALAPDLLLGKQLFYDASDVRLSQDSYMACAACHNDGGQDGRIWDFAQFGEGLRNTITLQGHGSHGPLHWTANFDEVQDFEGQIRDFGGGTGLMSDPDFLATQDPLGAPKAGLSTDLDALAAYVESLTDPGTSPHTQGGGLTPPALAGREVFSDEGCGGCHSGAEFTDSPLGLTHDVGTLNPATSGPQTALDTPTLRGLWSTEPYLHDGSEATLDGAVAAHNGVALDPGDMADLVAYLEQIDGNEAQAPNSTPVIVTPPSQSDPEGGAVSLPITASDPDEDLLTFSAANLPDGLSIDENTGEISGTLTQTSGGLHAVVVTADDGDRSRDANFDWDVTVVNVPPVVQDPGSQSNDTGDTVALAITASDVDLDTLAFSATGLPDGLTIDSQTGVISGQIAGLAAGGHAVTVFVDDSTVVVPVAFGWQVDLSKPPRKWNCGLGFEAALVLVPLAALRRRRRVQR